ncbi:MAG TPA: hypothetical protein VFR47_10260 [Anaerolineales bacterium]|nr:hypothetical protein [Anaerolineales bacterium]
MATPKGLAARAVLELSDGRKIHIEIRDGSMFVKFYAVYTVRGRGRRRTVERESFRDQNFAASIDGAARKLEQHFNTYGKAKVNKTTTRIYRNRLYAKRLKMRPDELGLARIHNSPGDSMRKRQQSQDIFTRKTEAALV